MSSLICFVCHDGDNPTPAELATAVNDRAGTVLKRAAESKETGFTVHMPGGMVMTMSLPAPFPDPVLDDLAQRMAWPEWPAAHKAWRSHMVVFIMGYPKTSEGTRAAAASLLQAASAAASGTGASALAWGGSLVFHTSVSLADKLKTALLPPEFLIRPVFWREGDGRVGMRTEGLRVLGLPEINHPPTGEDAGSVYNRMMNLCSYVLDRGPVLADGHTFGTDQTPSMRVHHDRDAEGNLLVTVLPVASDRPPALTFGKRAAGWFKRGA